MTAQEKYNAITNILSKPEVENRIDEIERFCEQEKKHGILFHRNRASNMLSSLKDASPVDRRIYESSLNTSIDSILMLLEQFGCM